MSESKDSSSDHRGKQARVVNPVIVFDDTGSDLSFMKKNQMFNGARHYGLNLIGPTMMKCEHMPSTCGMSDTKRNVYNAQVDEFNALVDAFNKNGDADAFLHHMSQQTDNRESENGHSNKNDTVDKK